MKWIGIGLGVGLGLGLAYALFASEMARLLVVGLGGFLLAVVTIGGTVYLVNRQWTRALGGQKITHNHRYPHPPPVQVGPSPPGQPDLLPPPPFEIVSTPLGAGMEQNVDDEVVA